MMTDYEILKAKLSSLSTKQTYSPTHKRDGMHVILSLAEENNCFDYFTELIDNNPDMDFDGIAKLIFSDVPELEVVDD